MVTLLLDNFLNPKYSKYFSRYYQDDLKVFLASKMDFPDNITEYSHIILSGSEESILNDRDWITREMELVREILRPKIPTLGICFGHQLIARALLGENGVKRADYPEIGWKEVTVQDNNPLFSKLEEKFYVFDSHFDEVCNLEGNFHLLATSDLCAVSAFQVKGSPVWGIQFHPEIDIESGKKFIKDIKHLAPVLDLDWEIENAKESGISKTLFENFYDQ